MLLCLLSFFFFFFLYLFFVFFFIFLFVSCFFFFFFQAEDGIRDGRVTGVQTCALPIWLAFGGAVLFRSIAADSLVPVAWQVRSGLHWLTEHFLAYLAATSIFCLALQRPVIVVGVAMALAALMEGLQGLTADRIPDLLTALSGVAGEIGRA